MSTFRDVIRLPIARPSSTTRAISRESIAVKRSSLRLFITLLGLTIVSISAGLMVLNTFLVHGAFSMQSLQKESQSLERVQQAVGNRLAIAESPARLAAEATRLGMQPAKNPVFLKISGVDSARSGVSSASMPH